ncbi:MAG: L-lysine 6-transaminase [Candidatus Kapaibacterium sp.]
MNNASSMPFRVQPDSVHGTLQKHMLVDGFPFVLDLDRSGDGYYADAVSGRRFVDFFSCFASVPLRLNNPDLRTNDFIHEIGTVALHKPSNSDLYTDVMAGFVDTLFSTAAASHFTYSFFIEGGALANENALKVAFDWKVRKNFAKGHTREVGHKIIHFQQAFHGRSGYTMSLTNTDPNKVALFPKFDFPRVLNPKMEFPCTGENLDRVMKAESLAIRQIRTAIAEHGDDIAALIMEPIQGEGGDNHFRTEFLQQVRSICDEHDILLIFDEVQTGVGMTGTWWAFEQLGVKPDIMSFGKKMQVCGILVSDRIDDIDDHVFRVSSRINSTWGGNLVDMARAQRYLSIIHQQGYLANAAEQGEYLKTRMNALADEFPGLVSNVRGRGLFAAFDLVDAQHRAAFIEEAYKHGLLILGCGAKSVRFRPTLDVSRSIIDEGMGIIETVIRGLRLR